MEECIDYPSPDIKQAQNRVNIFLTPARSHK